MNGDHNELPGTVNVEIPTINRECQSVGIVNQVKLDNNKSISVL